MADSLPTEIRLNIVTPDHLVAQDAVTWVSFRGKDGYLGILPGHAPLITILVPGELVYTRDGTNHNVVVTEGFAEVLPDRVIVLVQAAERAEEINVERSKKALSRAEERLKRFDDPEIDKERARKALTRAMARLEAARKSKGKE